MSVELQRIRGCKLMKERPRYELLLLIGMLSPLLISCENSTVRWTECDSTLTDRQSARVWAAAQRDPEEAARLWIDLSGEAVSIGDASGIGQHLVAGGAAREAIPHLKIAAHSDCFYNGFHLLLVAEAYYEIGSIEEAKRYASLTREFLRNDTVDRGESLAPPGVKTSHLVRDGLNRLDEKIDELAWEEYRQSSRQE